MTRQHRMPELVPRLPLEELRWFGQGIGAVGLVVLQWRGDSGRELEMFVRAVMKAGDLARVLTSGEILEWGPQRLVGQFVRNPDSYLSSVQLVQTFAVSLEERRRP